MAIAPSWEPKERISKRLSPPSRFNLNCVLSLCLVFAGIWLLGISMVMSRNYELRFLSGILALLVFPTVFAAVLLAIMGLRDCRRQPERFRSSGGMAITTLWIAGLSCFILVPVMIAGIKGAIRGAKARQPMVEGRAELLKFRAENFTFHSPSPPWRQLDARKFGPWTAVAFGQPGPIFFIINTTNVGSTLPDARDKLVDWCKNSDRRKRGSYRLISEGKVDRNGIEGWQMESQDSYQGHDYYTVNWVVVTNGFGYIMRMWSSTDLRDRAKEAADYIYSRFEPMPATNIAP